MQNRYRPTSDPSAFRCFPLPPILSISSGPLPNQCPISMPTSSYGLYRHSPSEGCTNYMLASFSFQCSHLIHLTSPRFCLSNILHPFSPNSLYYQPACVLWRTSVVNLTSPLLSSQRSDDNQLRFTMIL